MRHLLIAALAAACLTAIAKQPEIPPAVQARIDSITERAKSNDVIGIQRELNAIEWEQVADPKPTVKALAKAMPKGENGKELRRQVKTKYILLREDEADIDELADVEAYAVPIVKLSPIVLDPVEIASLVFVPLSIGILNVDSLNVPYVNTKTTQIVFIRVDDMAFNAALAAWERRWGIAIDATGPGQARIIPHPATALGIARAALMARIDRDGWTAQVEADWTAYHQALAAALGRRARLTVREEDHARR